MNFKLNLEKAGEPEIKLPTSVGSSKKKEFQKNINFRLLITPKPWLCRSQQTVENSWRDGTTRLSCLPHEKLVCKSRSNSYKWCGTGSKLEKEYVKAVYCHLVYLTSMQSTSCELPGWMKLKLESRLSGEISITSDMQMIPPLWQKMKRN